MNYLNKYRSKFFLTILIVKASYDVWNVNLDIRCLEAQTNSITRDIWSVLFTFHNLNIFLRCSYHFALNLDSIKSRKRIS